MKKRRWSWMKEELESTASQLVSTVMEEAITQLKLERELKGTSRPPGNCDGTMNKAPRKLRKIAPPPKKPRIYKNTLVYDDHASSVYGIKLPPPVVKPVYTKLPKIQQDANGNKAKLEVNANIYGGRRNRKELATEASKNKLRNSNADRDCKNSGNIAVSFSSKIQKNMTTKNNSNIQDPRNVGTTFLMIEPSLDVCSKNNEYFLADDSVPTLFLESLTERNSRTIACKTVTSQTGRLPKLGVLKNNQSESKERFETVTE